MEEMRFPFPHSPLQHHPMVYSLQPNNRALHRLTGHGQATSEQAQRGAGSEPLALSAQEAPCHATHQVSTGGS